MRLELQNFRCFRKATVDFTPLTVVIGPNASGKSTLVRALDPDLLQRLSLADVWQGRTENSVSVRTRLSNKVERSFSYDWKSPVSVVATGAYSYAILRLDAARLRSANTAQRQFLLSTGGDNLTSVFDTLTRSEQSELAKTFCSLVPVFGDIDRIAGPSAGQIRLRFQDRWNAQRWYEVDEVSDGTMFTLAFLLLSKQQPPIDVLAIEDPEHGLHPFLLGEVVSLLRRLAKGELNGRPVNVVLTTHSPTLLEFVDPSEVRLLGREEDGSVSVSGIPTQDPRWREAFKVYDESLGQAWLSGGLGATP